MIHAQWGATVALAALCAASASAQSGWTLEMTTDRRQYAPGRAVELRVITTNRTDYDRVVLVRDGQEMLFSARDARTGRVVWSGGKKPQAPYSFRLGPGETRTGSAIWDRRDDDGKPAPAGVYTLEARSGALNLRAVAQIYLADTGSDSGENSGGGRPGSGRPGDDSGRPGSAWPGRGTIGGRLEVDRSTARIGDTVRFTYTVVNRGRDTVALTFPSGKQFDVEAQRTYADLFTGTPTTVWRLSQGQFYTQALTRFSLGPGEVRSFRGQLTIASGTATEPYNLVAYLTPAGEPDGRIGAAVVPLRIVY
jgi:hypothetical protein